MRGAGGDDERGVDAFGVFGDLLDQGVGEDVLRNGDGYRAAEGVEEDGDCVCRYDKYRVDGVFARRGNGGIGS